MDPNEVAECWSWLPLLHPEVIRLPLALLSQAKLPARHLRTAIGQPQGHIPCSQKAHLAPSGKIPFVQLDVANRPNRLPKTSGWRLC